MRLILTISSLRIHSGTRRNCRRSCALIHRSAWKGDSRKSEVRCRLLVGAVLVEVCDEPQGTHGERIAGPDSRVRSVRHAAVRGCGDGALVRRMGVHGDLLRLLPGDHSLGGPRKPRAPGRETGRPHTEGPTALGQGVRGCGDAPICCLADLDASGCWEIRLVADARLVTSYGSLGTCALFLRSVLDLPGERVSRTGSESSRGEGPECGDYRPVPVREASHVWEHVLVFAGKCTPFGLLVGLVALPGDSGPTCLEDHPRRADAEERPGRIRRVRTAG